MSFSDSGSTSGPMVVMLALSALPAVSITSRPILVPILPSSSSLVITQLPQRLHGSGTRKAGHSSKLACSMRQRYLQPGCVLQPYGSGLHVGN